VGRDKAGHPSTSTTLMAQMAFEVKQANKKISKPVRSLFRSGAYFIDTVLSLALSVLVIIMTSLNILDEMMMVIDFQSKSKERRPKHVN